MTENLSRRQKLIALLQKEKAKTLEMMKSLGDPPSENESVSRAEENRIHVNALGAINQHEEFLREYYKIMESDTE